MKNLNPGAENGRRNGVVGLGLRPDQVPTTINIKVSHGHNEYELAVPSNSSFADLKSAIAKQIGLKLENHKLLFRGKEKEDDEYLETAGVKENSKVLLVEDTTHELKINEEVKETSVISKGGEAVAEIKIEVDKLSEQVSSLQATLDSGKKVDEKNIIFLTEMLMRQLLKLDVIEAEGEGKIQRKMEVRRVQSLVDTMDVLKSRNSNPSNNVAENSAPVTTQWESFEPAHESANSPSAPGLVPSSSPSSVPSSAPSHVPSLVPSHVSPAAPSPGPSPSSSHGTSSAAQYYAPTPTTSYGLSAHAPPYHYDAASTYASFPHETPPSHAPYTYAAPYAPPTHYAPNPTPSYGPSSHAPPYNYDAPPYNYDAPPTYASFPHETPPSCAPFPHGAPYAPTHYAPNPYAPASYPHNPYETAPYAPNPHASSYHAPSHMPPHDPSGTQSYDPSSGSSYAPTMPSSTKVTRDWERFE